MSKSSEPLVSVIIPSYNTNKKYLKQSLESVLSQTYKNIEVIFIDDGSQNGDGLFASQFNDNRISVYYNDNNYGLPYTLNRAISLSSGKYIARMDSDDIATNDRIRIQVDFLEKHSNIDIVGSYAMCFGAKKVKYRSASKSDDIKAMLLFSNPMIHPTVMFRKDSFVEKNIMYSDKYISEDYNIWIDCAFKHKLNFANIRECLLDYRIHNDQITMKKAKDLLGSEMILYDKVLKYFDIVLEDPEKTIYYKFAKNKVLSKQEIKILKNIFLRILEGNSRFGYINQLCLKKQIINKYQKYCIKQFLRRIF